MKPHKLIRTLGIAALILVALGGLGAALNNRSSAASTHDTAITDIASPDGSDDVMNSIDQALGRQSTTAQTNAPTLDKASPPIAAVAPGALESKSSAQYAAGSAGTTSSVAAAPAAAPPSPTDGSSPDASTDLDDRKIVQTATLKLQVKDVGDSFQDVSRIATGAGGFVASSNFSLTSGDQQIAALTIRVPADRYQDVLTQLRATGAKVDSEASSSSDVTGEYTDLTSKLTTLQATQAQLLTLLGQAKTINDILQVQDRLNTNQAQIDQSKGRIALLDKLSDLATISVSHRPVVGRPQTPHSTTSLSAKAHEAWQNSLDFLGSIAGGILTVLIFAWWLPLIAIPAYLIANRHLRNRQPPISAVD